MWQAGAPSEHMCGAVLCSSSGLGPVEAQGDTLGGASPGRGLGRHGQPSGIEEEEGGRESLESPPYSALKTQALLLLLQRL